MHVDLFSIVLILQKLIEETEEKLLQLDGVTTVHSRYYELCSNYHKLMGNHAQYYRDALRFLGCMELSDLTSEYTSIFKFSVLLMNFIIN